MRVVGCLLEGDDTEQAAYPWWEAVVMLRRIATSAISVVPSSVLQAVLALTLFMALLLAQMHCKPYRSAKLNRLELLVLLVAYANCMR